MRRVWQNVKGYIARDFARTLSFASFALIALFAIILGVSITMLYTRANEQSILSYSRNVTDAMLVYTDEYYSSIIEAPMRLVYSEAMQDAVQGKNLYPFEREPVLSMENLREFSDFQTQLMDLSLGLQDIYIFSSDVERVLYYARKEADPDMLALVEGGKYKDTAWYRAARDSGGAFLPHPVDGGSDQLYYFVKQIRGLRSGREIGTICFSLDPTSFLKRCAKYKRAPEDIFLVINERQTFGYLSDPISGDIAQAIKDEAALGKAHFAVYAEGAGYQITAVQSGVFGWTICYGYSLASFGQTTRGLLLTICLIAILELALFFLIATGMGRRLSMPIARLKDGMKAVEDGNYAVHVPVNASSDLNDLIASFNKMAAELSTSIERAYVSELQRRDAQLLTMQSQIQPHFLYNSLNSIQMTAILSKDYKTSRMLAQLGTLLHYVMSMGSGKVTLRNEMDIVNSYVDFRLMQEDKALTLRKDIPAALSNAECLKMALQPIVENCFGHGDVLSAKSPVIHIRAEAAEDGYLIVVRNNGRVITQARADEVMDSLRSATDINSIKGHIGLANVHYRLRVYYGPRSGISIWPDGDWTAVKIRLVLA